MEEREWYEMRVNASGMGVVDGSVRISTSWGWQSGPGRLLLGIGGEVEGLTLRGCPVWVRRLSFERSGEGGLPEGA